MTARLRYLAACALRRATPWRRTGPGPGHLESLAAELSPDDEDWLAGLDRELWPRHGQPGRLGATYTLRYPAKGDTL
ncbi:MAG TPA: hypothetical protein VGM53_35430 [Streptosporangiaceae bacterium]|jgi:hypothetical protein